METLLKIIRKLTPRKDKLKHFFWGFWFSLIGLISAWIFNFIYLVIIIPGICGVIKEIYDAYDGRYFDIRDFLFTVLPGLIIFAMLWL